jgi:hypothetical protein
MDNKTKRTWISIAIAAVVIFVVLAVSVVAGAAFWFRRHVEAHFTSDTVAIGEFERERARFAGQVPLIEMRPDFDGAVIHRRPAASPATVQTLRILAFEPDAGKIVRVSIPFWLLRLAPSRHVRFFSNAWSSGPDTDRSGGPGRWDGSDAWEGEKLHLTVHDLEEAGPGLVLDAHGRRDGQLVLIWTE